MVDSRVQISASGLLIYELPYLMIEDCEKSSETIKNA